MCKEKKKEKAKDSVDEKPKVKWPKSKGTPTAPFWWSEESRDALADAIINGDAC